MIIRPIDIKRDRPSIIEIWMDSFTNNLSYIESFIDYCLPYTNSWVLLCDNKPVSILSLIPSYIPYPSFKPFNHENSSDNLRKTLLSEQKKLYGAYIYGVATLPEYRGNSYSRLLVDKAIKYSIEKELDYIIVKPAQESLFDLYRKMGIKTTLYHRKTQVHLTNSHSDISRTEHILESQFVSSHISSLSTENLFEVREHSNLGSFLWTKKILDYAIREVLSHPEAIAASNENLYFIAIPSNSSPNHIEILETNAQTKEQMEEVISLIRNKAPQAQSISICTNQASQSGIFDIFKNPTTEKSALLKVLSPDIKIERYLSEQYLSLPME